MSYGAQVAAFAAGIGIAVVAAPAAADFDGHRMLGEGAGFPDSDSPTSFEEIVNPDAPEFVWHIADHPFDGFYLNFSGSTLTLKISLTDFEWSYWPEEEFVGFLFTDIDQTMDGFESLTLIDSQGDDIPWIDMDFGVISEDQFYFDVSPISGLDYHLYNRDFFTLEMTFVPAPAGGLLLLGACAGRRRRN